MASSTTSRSKQQSAAALRPKRFGSETPRIFTPPLRPLTRETTLGFDVIDFAATVLGIELFPWQKWLLIHMLELLPDGSLRFRTAVVLVARQNGKSTLSQVLALWFMVVWGWPLVLGTAQDLETAEEVWQGAVDLVEEDEELSKLLKRVVKVNGKKALELTTGARYKVKAANRRAGRGFTGNLIMLDELREHQSWDAWGAITKTTMAQTEALVLALSNAGDATSIVLRYLRKMAHAAVGDPDGINSDDDPSRLLPTEGDLTDDDLDVDDDFEQDEDTLFLAEWSAPPSCDVRDRDAWAMANPSMGYSITERTIASACRTDPEWVFRTEVLCQWSDGSLEGPFPPGTWEAGRWIPSNPKDAPPKIVGNVKACIDVSHDRTMTYISFAGYREDGLPQVEVVAQRAGQEWAKDWLMEPKRRARIDAVTGQSKGAPVSGLMKNLKVALEDDTDAFDVPIEDWGGDDLAGWTGEFYDLVRAGAITDDGEQVGIRHLPQPVLDVAAATAVTKPLGERFVWDRSKSATDIASLVSATGAVGLLLQRKVPTKTSVYEERGMVTL